MRLPTFLWTISYPELGYNTNYDYKDLSSPLSHAGLIKLYIEGKYSNHTDQDIPYTKEQLEDNKIKKKESKKKTINKKRVKKEKNTGEPSLF